MAMQRRSPPLPPLPSANFSRNPITTANSDTPPELPRRPKRNKIPTETDGASPSLPSRPPTKPPIEHRGAPPKLPDRPSIPKPPIETEGVDELTEYLEPITEQVGKAESVMSEDGAGCMYEVADGGEVAETMYEVPTMEVAAVGPNMGDPKQICAMKLKPADIAKARKNLSSLPPKEPVPELEKEKEPKKPSPLPKPPQIKTQIVRPNNAASGIANSLINNPAPNPPIPKVHPFEKKRESNSEDNSSAGSTSSGSGGPRSNGRLPLRFFPNANKSEIPNCNSSVPRHPVPAKPKQSEPVSSLQEDQIYDDAVSKSLLDYDWYHGDIDRVEGTKRIKTNFVNGTFLLRTSTKHMYALMVVLNNEVYNLIVRQRADGKFAIGTEKKDEVAFNSILDLVEHHKNSPVTVIGGKGNKGGVGSVKLCQTPPKK